MLLTRKTSTSVVSPTSLVESLSRGVARSIPTMDRRAFLRRSGLGVGAGLAASQLTLVKKARAADAETVGGGGAKVEVQPFGDGAIDAENEVADVLRFLSARPARARTSRA